MSFFSSFGGPSKAESEVPHPGPGDFNMFGCSSSSKESGSGAFFGGAEDSSGGSFFGSGPGAGEPGGSSFSSAAFGTPRKPGEQNPAPSMFGPPEDVTTPAKKFKPDPSQPRYQQPSIPSAGTQWAAKPGLPDTTQAQSYGKGAPTQGRPGTGPPKPQVPPSNSQAMFHNSSLAQAQAKQALPHAQEVGRGAWQSPAPVKMQNINSSVQSSVLKEDGTNKPAHDDTKEEEDDLPADALLKDLIDMQKQQLCELLPEMRKGDEKSEQILDSARLVLKNVSNYGVKLAGVKQQYCSRLSQVSSFLRMIPKTEN